MKITKDTLVKFEYDLKDENGVLLDSTENGGADYIHGYDIILPALEKKFEGLEAGAEFDLTIPPAEGYGEYSDELNFEVEKSMFPEDIELAVGMEFESGNGGHLVRIKEIKDDSVIVDANHPFAGKTLNFSVKVIGVEKASEQDLNELQQMLNHASCGSDCHSGGCSSCGCGCH